MKRARLLTMKVYPVYFKTTRNSEDYRSLLLNPIALRMAKTL